MSPDFAGAIAMLEATCAPASATQLEAALAELSVQVNCYGADGARADLQLAVYVRQLQRYPADVAMQALRDWPRKSKPTRGGKDFAREWPNWFDLQRELDFWATRRRTMLDALRFDAERAGLSLAKAG